MGRMDIRVNPGTAGLDEPELGAPSIAGQELAPIGPPMPNDVLPVIHASTLELCVVELESQRFDQVQFCSCGGAKARHVSRVRRDLGFKQDHVHRHNLAAGKTEGKPEVPLTGIPQSG